MEYIAMAFVVKKEGKFFVSECTELDVSSFGTSESEALVNLGDAVEVYLNTLEELGEAHKVLEGKGIRVYQYEPSSVEIKRAKYPIGSTVTPSVIQFEHVNA